MNMEFTCFLTRACSRWPQLPIEEIRKRARILVIDDSDFFYLKLFEKDGYNINKWDDVQDLPKLENGTYDIILLDIQGVGKELSEDQGFGVLKYLRSVSPAQIIIAYSNADWSLKYQDFFSKADAILAKTTDYVDFKSTVDRLLMDRFSLRLPQVSVTGLHPNSLNMHFQSIFEVFKAKGDFANNLAMRQEHPPHPITVDLTVASSGDNGDGIRAGMTLGDDTALMDDPWWGPTTVYNVEAGSRASSRQEVFLCKIKR